MDILYGEVSVAMPLLNYTTKIPAEQTAAEIMSILVKKGATDILTHYGPEGMTTGLKWRMETAPGTMCPGRRGSVPCPWGSLLRRPRKWRLRSLAMIPAAHELQ